MRRHGSVTKVRSDIIFMKDMGMSQRSRFNVARNQCLLSSMSVQAREVSGFGVLAIIRTERVAPCRMSGHVKGVS